MIFIKLGKTFFFFFFYDSCRMHVSSEKQPVPIDGQWTGASLVIEIWKTLGSELPEQNLCSKIVPDSIEILLI